MRSSDVLKLQMEAIRTQHSNPEDVIGGIQQDEKLSRRMAMDLILAKIVLKFSAIYNPKPMMIERFEDLKQKRAHNHEGNG